jgi:hypothetical protein
MSQRKEAVAAQRDRHYDNYQCRDILRKQHLKWLQCTDVTPYHVRHCCTGENRDHLRALGHYCTVKKGKAVPLHAMEAFGGREGIAPTHSRPRH